MSHVNNVEYVERALAAWEEAKEAGNTKKCIEISDDLYAHGFTAEAERILFELPCTTCNGLGVVDDGEFDNIVVKKCHCSHSLSDTVQGWADRLNAIINE